MATTATNIATNANGAGLPVVSAAVLQEVAIGLVNSATTSSLTAASVLPGVVSGLNAGYGGTETSIAALTGLIITSYPSSAGIIAGAGATQLSSPDTTAAPYAAALVLNASVKASGSTGISTVAADVANNYALGTGTNSIASNTDPNLSLKVDVAQGVISKYTVDANPIVTAVAQQTLMADSGSMTYAQDEQSFLVNFITGLSNSGNGLAVTELNPGCDGDWPFPGLCHDLYWQHVRH